jgi:hypothetical protein
VLIKLQQRFYSYNKPTGCTVSYFILLPHLYMFRAVLSPSSEGQVYNVAMVLLLFFFASRPLDIRFENKEAPFHIVHLDI